MRARIIRPDGSTEPLELPDNGPARLRETCRQLSCDLNAIQGTAVIDKAPGRPGLEIWSNGANALTDPENVTARALVDILANVHACIHGVAILTGGADENGTRLGLSDIQDAVLADIIPVIADGMKARQP